MTTLRKITSRITNWLALHKPVQCQLCFTWLFKKDAIYEHHVTGARLRLCPSCHENIFHPFRKSGKWKS